jgi:hypothetical protein
MPANNSNHVFFNMLFPSTTALLSGKFSFYPYDLSINNEEYLTPNNVAEMTDR